MNECGETSLQQGIDELGSGSLTTKKQVSREAKDLVRQMLTIEQEHRPSASQILKTNQWLRKNTALYTHNN